MKLAHFANGIMVYGLAHAHLARQLIGACGGLKSAARACRVGKSVLGDYQASVVDLHLRSEERIGDRAGGLSDGPLSGPT